MKHLTVFLCLAGAVAIALAVSAPVVEAQLECGAEIWENTKLTEDLDCSGLDLGPWGAGLRIKGDNVTLDLGGHTIFGPTGGGGVVAAIHTTIKNGTITGFAVGVNGNDAYDLEVKNLLFTDQRRGGVMSDLPKGLVIKDSIFIGQGEVGVGFEGAEGVEIKDSTFIGCGVAIRFESSRDVSIKNIDATRCYYCVVAADENNDNVEIKDSTFHDFGLALLMSNTPGLKISGNHINRTSEDLCDEDCGGIEVHGPFSGGNPVSGIKITNNFVHDIATYGIIVYANIVDSEISSNHIYNNGDVGIALIEDSTDNKIESNITFGNGIDLAHDCSSSPNKWEDNRWETCAGTDINGCTNPCGSPPE